MTAPRRAIGIAATCAVALGVGFASVDVKAAQQAGAVRDPGRPAPPPAGTGVIAGTVTAGDSGRPLRRVRVSLEGDRGLPISSAITDTQGQFTLSRLPAGSFTLKAARTGFLEVIYGQKKAGSGRPGTAIQLAEAQRIEKVALQLPRGGVLSGVVRDEIGDPISGVPVRALRYIMRNGIRELTQAAGASATTDDRGQYRIFALVPGEYVLCAAPRDELVQAAALAESLRQRMQDINAAAAARGGMERVIPGVIPGAMPDAPTEAYVPICAPSTTQITGATSVTLDVSEEKSGNDLQLQLLPIARVSGTVSWPGGALPVGNTADDTYVSLEDASAIPGTASRGMHVPATGRFSFLNVPAGQYTLTARAGIQLRREPGGPFVPLALWASTDVTVTGQPVSDLMLSLDHGMQVSGRVVLEGAPSVDVTKMRVTASIAGNFAGELAPVVASPDAEGRFTLVGVVPGRYRIRAYPDSPGATNIKSSVFNDRDTLDFPIDVKPGEPLANGVITVIPRLAEISGQLQHDANQPATGFTVIAFTADQRYWTPQSRRVQGARPATDGRFSFRNLPAGEYRLVAVTDVEAGQWFDPAFLKELVSASISVTLGEGERREQVLRVIR